MRDLGGWAIPNGTTRYCRFVRSGLLNGLGRGDLRKALRYGGGVTHCLDLRSAEEFYAAPDVLFSRSVVEYRCVSLYDADLTGDSSLAGQMARGYRQMVENTEAVRRIFSWFARWAAASDGVILYHCTGGIDRSGVVTLLLLGLARASREDICREYLLSFASPDGIERALRSPDLEFGRTSLNDRYDLIAAVYDGLMVRYGSVYSYLLACGLTERQLRTVRDFLVG